MTAVLFDSAFLHYPLLSSGKRLEKERAAIVETIRYYNKILTDFYVTGGVPLLLDEFPAVKTLKHGLFRDIGFIRDYGMVLVYDLADMTPVDIRILSPNAAEAVIFEEWNYVYQRKEDREPVSRVKGLGQGFRYRLIKQNGAWIVRNWDPVDVEDPGDKGFVF